MLEKSNCHSACEVIVVPHTNIAHCIADIHTFAHWDKALMGFDSKMWIFISNLAFDFMDVLVKV